MISSQSPICMGRDRSLKEGERVCNARECAKSMTKYQLNWRKTCGMKDSVVHSLRNTQKILSPRGTMSIHPTMQELYQGLVGSLWGTISLRVESCRYLKFHVLFFPKCHPEVGGKQSIMVGGDGEWKTIASNPFFSNQDG